MCSSEQCEFEHEQLKVDTGESDEFSELVGEQRTIEVQMHRQECGVVTSHYTESGLVNTLSLLGVWT